MDNPYESPPGLEPDASQDWRRAGGVLDWSLVLAGIVCILGVLGVAPFAIWNLFIKPFLAD